MHCLASQSVSCLRSHVPDPWLQAAASIVPFIILAVFKMKDTKQQDVPARSADKMDATSSGSGYKALLSHRPTQFGLGLWTSQDVLLLQSRG
jgi:hypothetical protein